MTLPLDLGVAVAMGASVVLAARSMVLAEPIWRSAAWWALFVLQLVLVAPTGAFLRWRFPDWSLMYLLAPEDLPVATWSLGLMAPVVALLAFAVSRRMLARTGVGSVIGVLLGAIGFAIAIGFFGREQLRSVGTVAAFQGGGEGMFPVWKTPLVYLGPAAVIGVGSTWAITLWRLRLLSRSYRTEGDLGDTRVRKVRRGTAPVDSNTPKKSKSGNGRRRSTARSSS